MAALAAVADPGDTDDAHQPRHPFAAGPNPATQPQLGMNARCAVGAARGPMHLADLISQHRVIDIASRRPATEPLVVARPRNLEHPAGHRDIDTVSGKLLDQPEPYFGRTFSRAK